MLLGRLAPVDDFRHRQGIQIGQRPKPPPRGPRMGHGLSRCVPTKPRTGLVALPETGALARPPDNVPA